MPEIVFGTQSYVSPSLPLSAMRLLNCYFESQPQGTKSQTPLFGSPGLTSWTTLPTFPVRGMWNFRGKLYTVSGDTLYRVNAAGGYKILGTGISGTGVVSMSDNGVQQVTVNGTEGFIVNDADVFQQIVSPSFYSASTVLFFDDYFVFDRKQTNQFFLSGLLDGTSYNGDDFASAEAQPGFLTAVAQNLQLLFLFCQNHIEMWYDAGAQDFPFQRYAGGVIPRGCVSPYTIIAQDDALFFLGVDRVFYRLQGNVALQMSTHAVEAAFQSYGDISDAFCFTFTYRGHKMIALTFPSVPHTWLFDISTRMWHERESWDASNKPLGRWRANCACEIYDKILIGDAYSGTIGFLDPDNYTEYGNTIPWLAHSAPLHQDKLPIFVNRLELDVETGVGLDGITQGADPQFMLRWSKDGARTWSALQPWRSMGKIGDYLQRLRWLSLGRGYQFVFELTCTDPVKRVLIATHSDVGVGMR